MLVWAISTDQGAENVALLNGPAVEIARDWCLVYKYSSVIHTPYLDISGIHTRIYSTVQSRHNVHIQTYAIYSMEFLLIDIYIYIYIYKHCTRHRSDSLGLQSTRSRIHR